MFEQTTKALVFGTLLGLAVEAYELSKGDPHIPDHISVPSPLLNAPIISASGSIPTPFGLSTATGRQLGMP